jgi:hypothetical protein
MMSFFRAYQKVFFIVITCLVTLSFFFFGPSAGEVKQKVKEHALVKAINGSVITQEKVERLAEFLASSQSDLLDDKVVSANWLNDGVLEKDFFGTPMGAALAEKIFPSIEPELQQILNKIKSFQSYKHPKMPSLHAEVIWSQFAPGALQLASHLKLQSKATQQTFHQLSELYKGQKELPLLFCKRMMMYQERQENKIEFDNELPYADLSLLGLHTAKDWFGKKYLRAVAQVVINGAFQAKELGIDVSIQEVRQELLGYVQDAARRSGEKVEPSQLYGMFLAQVRKAGMEERECLDLWKDVMLFRKLLASFAENVTLDSSVLQAAEEAAKEEAVIDLFSLPSDLRPKDLFSVLKLQMYMDAISPEGRDPLALPQEVLSVEEIERKMPEIVRKEYVLEHVEFSLEKAALQVGVKETWDWEVNEGWNILAKDFPKLIPLSFSTKESRLHHLASLEEEQRFEIDQMARKKMLLIDPSRMEEILSSLQTRQDTYLVGSKGEGLPFKQLKDQKQVYALIQSGDTKKLNCYTEDGEHYYKIQVIQAPTVPRVLTYAEADSLGVLRQKLDAKLETLYTTVRKKDSSLYQQKDGSWKSLSEVKEKIGLLLFPTLIQAIQAEYTKVHGQEPSFEQKQSPAFYVQHRMEAPVRAIWQACQSKHELQEGRSVLLTQWDYIKERQIKKKKDLSISSEEFSLPLGSFSKVHLTGLGKGVFFQMIEKRQTQGLGAEEIKALRAPEEKLALRKGALDLIDTIFVKGAISL